MELAPRHALPIERPMAADPKSETEKSAFSGSFFDADDPTALVIADRLASLGTMVAGVAHEINNPITYVLGNLGELERLSSAMREAILTYRHRLGELVGESAANVIAEAETKVYQAGGIEVLDELIADATEGAMRIRDLVRDLLSLSRNSEGSTTPVNINDILDSTLRVVTRQLAPCAYLERDYEATRLIEGDRAKLGQVCLNLITNAIDACVPPDPTKQRIRARTRDTVDGVELEIQDSGGGIPLDVQPKIFSPFFTTKGVGDGTGLGLYISRRIIEDHGGTIEFRCEQGQGTAFKIWLPERPQKDNAQ